MLVVSGAHTETFSFQTVVNVAVLNFKRLEGFFTCLCLCGLNTVLGFFLFEYRGVLVWICQTKYVKLFTFLIHKLKACIINYWS